MASDRTVDVTFENLNRAEGPLSWGQQDAWMIMRRYRSSMPVGRWFPITSTPSVADVLANLRGVIERHESLRTRFLLDHVDQPRQVVLDSGTFPVDVIDAEPEELDAITDRTVRSYHEADFDFADGSPVRLALIAVGGRPVRGVLVGCHLSLDGFGALLAMRELVSPGVPGERGRQPVDQAAWQHSEAGRRHSALALREWRSLLGRMPPTWPAGSAHRESPRHWEGLFESPALAAGSEILMARTGASAATIMLAAYAVAMGRLSGSATVAVQPVSSNRFRPGLATVACTASQPGFCLLDVAGITFGEALARTSYAALSAYKFAYQDPRPRQEALLEAESAKGALFFPDTHFNDRRFIDHDRTGAHAPADLDVSSIADGTLRWIAAKDTPSARLFLQVEDVSGPALLNVFADTAFLSRDAAQELLQGMEHVVVAAVSDLSTVLRVA